jgi:ribosomal small subunit protein bTHX
MGKGDKKTRRGKIIIGTYGVRRPKKNRGSINPSIKDEKVKITAKKPEVTEPPKEKKKPAAKKVREVTSEEVKTTPKKKSTGKTTVKSVETKEKTQEDTN